MRNEAGELEWSDDDFDKLWNRVPGSEFFDATETEQYQQMLEEALDVSLNNFERIDKTVEFQAFLEEIGLAVEDFDWNFFREWVEAMYDGD